MKMQCSANSVTVNTYHAIQPKFMHEFLWAASESWYGGMSYERFGKICRKMRALAAEKCSRTRGRNRWVGAFFQAMWWLDWVGVVAGRGVRASLHRVQYFTS